MIKIKNGEASAFNSQAIADLFSNDARQFPVEDAFRLLDMIDSIQKRLETYHKTVKRIIDDHQGKVDGKGRITYPNMENQESAQQKIMSLNEIEIEIAGERINPNDQWPKLTLTEAAILRPLLKNGHETV